MQRDDTKGEVLALGLEKAGLSGLKTELDPQIYAAYIEPLRISAFDTSSGEVTVAAPSKLVCNHVEKNFREKISKEITKTTGSDNIRLKFAVDVPLSEIAKATESIRRPIVVKKRPVEALNQKPALTPLSSGLNPSYTFSSFIVGNSNQFCHAAAMQVAENPGKSYNPLFVYGGVGLGKTHLLHAIGNEVLRRNPEARVLYISSETFTNELIHAVRNSKMGEFKDKYRTIEVLLIDDIQFMAGKQRTQEEFFHTFNCLHDLKHQVVITSDTTPQEIPGLEERLKTRFASGLTADLEAPDFETRVAILKKKSIADSFSVPDEILTYIASSVSSNIRELEGALTRLHALVSLQRVPLTLAGVETALKPLLQPRYIKVSVNDIKRVVSEHFGIKVADMISKRRTKNLCFPRHIAMFLCRKLTTCSYPEIGGHFGGRDHSSVIHAYDVVRARVDANAEVRDLVAAIERKLLDSEAS